MRLVNATTKEQLKEVRALYESAFPRSEKKPFGMILRGRKKGNYEIFTLENEDGEFQGLAITMLYRELVLLDYFAIEPGCRGGGAGSLALKALQQAYRGKKFLLEIESTLGTEEGDESGKACPQSQEASLRLRRKAFYLRNGMRPMDFLVNLFGVEMELLTYECDVTFEEYHAILEHNLPLGMARRVKKVAGK